MKLRVAILHDRVPAGAPPDAQDTLVQLASVSDAIRELGFEPIAFACSLDLEALRAWLFAERPAVVFNLVESLNGRDSLLPLVPALLDVIGVPYTGSPAAALFATTDKIAAKKRMLEVGLPTPPWIPRVTLPREAAPRRSDAEAGITGPYLLKAVGEHASMGIEDSAIVQAAGVADLQSRIAEQSRRLGRPCFAEKYVAGREINIALLERAGAVEVLPASEIDFSAFPPGKPRIVGYRAKWDAASEEYANTPRRLDFLPEDQPLLEALGDLALSCWHSFGLRGYARVDFRVDTGGSPWILEVNANPSLAPDAGFAAALAKAGIPYKKAVAEIIVGVLPILRSN